MVKYPLLPIESIGRTDKDFGKLGQNMYKDMNGYHVGITVLSRLIYNFGTLKFYVKLWQF